MKKVSITFLMCLLVLFAMGFSKKSELVLTSVETSVIQTERILRYDFKVINTGSKRIMSTFDYPGHHPLGIEVTVRPNDKLASLMVMEENTAFRKMRLRGAGAAGILEPGIEASFHVEYQIKNNVDFEQVKTNSLDGVLLILDGPRVIAEIPLNASLK